LLESGGRMVAISFMSLEDRKVKQRFRDLAQEGRAIVLTRHPVTPTTEETGLNPASRSAKLRALQMN
jgi:16S rRNA (cytosine1402-N4)-methyltransferase